MKLLNGISGFYDVEAIAIPPSVNGTEFKKICHSIAATVTDGKLIDYKEPLTITNFYQASITIQDTVIHVLLNAHYPIVAFASFIEPFNIIFIDSTQLSNQFRMYYTVVCSGELNEPLRYIELKDTFVLGNDNDLNNTELEQVRYWKPRTVGELAFNFWD